MYLCLLGSNYRHVTIKFLYIQMLCSHTKFIHKYIILIAIILIPVLVGVRIVYILKHICMLHGQVLLKYYENNNIYIMYTMGVDLN